ncbi:NAD(P)/FAD-dependent oxidoreductase [Aestuariispira insulae]|uniref:L-2-hydroxyglutarate oxidase LhgO n=1 Tax=Aestuariispira insulae TaxID=1461337 RepID=A0A3D9HNC0_9PROT|nr:NAD(P)/FAD-dependent oxidoreductase [Aestuariispira insulae]RED50993.1 L-2-hydroxyglutarate oxidase LhgO [Aestuariispira insulae]
MDKATVDSVVIGAGVVGLAVARALARQGRDVIILEAEDAIGTGISSRNSEVIHAGIYYPQGSLKARLCLEGNKALYQFCEAFKVEYRRCGKLIVASANAQVAQIEGIQQKAIANGVDDLTPLDQGQAQSLEPELNCVAALLSPSTGIIDSHGYMLALQGDSEAHGAMIAFQSPVREGETLDNGAIRLITGGEAPMELTANLVINAAGLAAPSLARRIAGLNPDNIPKEYLCKGNYFVLDGKAPFSHLIYPMPDEAGLGVHLTLDLGGQAKFGPDTQWIDQLEYPVDPARANSFYDAVRSYWPGLRDGALMPGYSGIRPKIAGPNEAAADFVIQGPSDHGVPGLVNLFGIESPGLTASLAIADYVCRLTDG